MGRFWRRKLRLQFEVDSSTLWHVLFIALAVRHPWSAVYRAAVRQQLRVLNSTRRALAEWAAVRWFQHGPEATERTLKRALEEIGWEMVDAMRLLREDARAPVLQLPSRTWAQQVGGAEVAV